MYAEVDVFVGNNTIVDPEIYQFWLDGYTAQETAAKILYSNQYPMEITLEDMVSDVLDHFRTFHMVERFLHTPPHLADQWTFQIAPQIQKMLIERYYEFDDVVIREFLGKKLSSRNRKDLDDVSEKTGINIKSCRRQFDNVKRVYKLVEDLVGPLIPNIESNFLLPDHLARKYAAIAFLTNIRFETGKKKLNYLVLDDFLYCAHQMMANWSSAKESEENPLELDRVFLLELRELKVILERENLEEHKNQVLLQLRPKLPQKSAIELDNNFKVLSRTLITIACGLNQSKEIKDLFVDLVEKFIEPCRHAQFNATELSLFLTSYTETASKNILSSELRPIWDKYMKTISNCILKMYHN